MTSNEKPKQTKRQQPNVGDIFIVPLGDGSYGAGQLLAVTKNVLDSCICAFFKVRVSNPESLSKNMPDRRDAISVQFVSVDSLRRGIWPILFKAELAFEPEAFIPLSELEAKGFVGAKIHGSGSLQKLVAAYHGLRPWDEYAEQGYFDKLLLPGVPRPAAVVFKKSE